jgi:hypothetical protein
MHSSGKETGGSHSDLETRDIPALGSPPADENKRSSASDDADPVESRAWRGSQAVLDAAEPVGSPAVAPLSGYRRAANVPVARCEDRDGENAGYAVDDEHHARTDERADQARARVEEAEARPERGAVGRRLHVGRVVEKPVRDQEEHRHHAGDHAVLRKPG